MKIIDKSGKDIFLYTDTTGYAETVHVKFNKQGHDEGTRYRTVIFQSHSSSLYGKQRKRSESG